MSIADFLKTSAAYFWPERSEWELTVVVYSTLLGLCRPPILHGDGVHDDTAALQALVDGRHYILADGCGTRFLITDTIRMGPRSRPIDARIIQCTGHADAIRADVADRRFTIIPTLPRARTRLKATTRPYGPRSRRKW